MKKRYDEIMDKIEVTDEMRSRILQNIQRADIASQPKTKVIRFPAIPKYLSIAACFAVLLIGALIVPHLLNPEQGNEPGLMAPGGDIVTVDSAGALSQAVGFEVNDLTDLPFTVDETTYTAYWQEMAEITYTGDGQSVTFRKSIGEDDNSGDYSTYENVMEKELNGNTVTLKGNGNAYTLAVWSDDNFSYSLQISDGISVMEWESLIAKVN